VYEIRDYPGSRTEELHVNRDLLNKLLLKLDKKSRQILVYRFYDDMTQEEIAVLTGYSRKTVAKKLNVIKLTVRQMLKDESADSLTSGGTQ
jgi:RNA polymerase sigma factor (sigma-70 family)